MPDLRERLAEFRSSRSLERFLSDADSFVPKAYAGSQSHAARIPETWRLSPNQRIFSSAPGDEAKALEMLAKSLQIMGLPPYREKFIDAAIDAPAVTWAGLPSIWKLAVFQEGGRQDSGNILYALDSSWFIQTAGPDNRNQLHVTKALFFAEDGRTPILATYKFPRRVRYFGNWLTLDAFETASGVPLENNLDVPMSSSSRLEKVTADKLWTRLLVAARGVRVPATCAFLMPDHIFLRAKQPVPASETVEAVALPKNRAAVRRAVVDFLGRFKGAEVVVKPSGPRFHSGEGVRFFARAEVDAIANGLIELSTHERMDSTKAVLLEQRLSPPPVFLRTDVEEENRPGMFVYQDKKKRGVLVLTHEQCASAEPNEKKDYNERLFVVCDGDGIPRAVPLTFFRAGRWGLPTSGQPRNPEDAAALADFVLMRSAWSAQYGGLMSTEAEVSAYVRERADIGERAMSAIIENEMSLPREDGEPFQARTDMIGLDLMYQLEAGRLVPYVIEINDHDAAGQFALDLFHPERAGEHSRVWIETMRRRALRDAQTNP
jgi:hypothetical protein